MFLPVAAAILANLLLGVLGQEIFNNPVVYEDFADNDVFRGPDDIYYFSASNMHYSPGAPILRSEDLANWEIIGHSVPSLSWSPKYNMTDGEIGYRGGTWASTMRYRESTGIWHWMGCIDFWYSYVYTAPDVTGPWTQASMIENCYYDSGLFIDDDDSLYIVHDNTNVSMTLLSDDGLTEVKTQQIIMTPEGFAGLEGNRMYKRNDTYYILNDAPGSATLIWKSSSPWGPWTYKVLGENVPSPVPGGGAPHQVNDGLTLSTVTVVDDFYHAQNTLTHRIHGPEPVGIVEIDFTDMADGDYSLLLFAINLPCSRWFAMEPAFPSTLYTTSTKMRIATGKPSTLAQLLRQNPYVTRRSGFVPLLTWEQAARKKEASTDGASFTEIGGTFAMNTDWQFFMGYRYGIFNFATKKLGGSIQVASFSSE